MGAIQNPLYLSSDEALHNIQTNSSADELSGGINTDNLDEKTRQAIANSRPFVPSVNEGNPDTIPPAPPRGISRPSAVATPAVTAPVAAAPAASSMAWQYDPTPSAPQSGVMMWQYEGPAVTPAAPEPPKDERGDFMRNLDKSWVQAKQTAAGTYALVGDTIGNESMKQSGLKAYQGYEDEVKKLTKDTDSFVALTEGKGSVIDWMQGAAGYMTGQVLEFGATSLAGAALGSALPGAGTVGGAVVGFVEKEAVKTGVRGAVAKMLEGMYAKKIAEGMTEEAAKIAAGKAVMGAVGAKAGSFLASSTMELGSIYGDAVEEAHKTGKEYSLGKIWLTGIGAAVLDTAMDWVSFGKVKGALGGPDAAKSVFKETFKGAAREGITEGIQTAMERYGASKSLTDSEAIRDYIDSAALGAFGGGMMGAGSAGISKFTAGKSEAEQQGQRQGQADAQKELGGVKTSSDGSSAGMFMGKKDLFETEFKNPGVFAALYQTADQREKEDILKAADRMGLRDDVLNPDPDVLAAGQSLIGKDADHANWVKSSLVNLGRTNPMNTGAKSTASMPPNSSDIDKRDAEMNNSADYNEQLNSEVGGTQNIGTKNPKPPATPTFLVDQFLFGQPRQLPPVTEKNLDAYAAHFGDIGLEVMGMANSPRKDEAFNLAMQQMLGVGFSTKDARSILEGTYKQTSGSQGEPKPPKAAINYDAHQYSTASVRAEFEKFGVDPALVKPSGKRGQYVKGDVFRAVTALKEQRGGLLSKKRKERNPAYEFLSTIGNLGGISIDWQHDIVGEPSGKGSKGRGNVKLPGAGGVLFKKGGFELDEIAKMLVDQGYLSESDIDSPYDNGGVNKLTDMIVRAINGEPIYRLNEEAAYEDEYNRRYEDDLFAHASNLGINATGMDVQELLSAIDAAEKAKDSAYQKSVSHPDAEKLAGEAPALMAQAMQRTNGKFASAAAEFVRNLESGPYKSLMKHLTPTMLRNAYIEAKSLVDGNFDSDADVRAVPYPHLSRMLGQDKLPRSAITPARWNFQKVPVQRDLLSEDVVEERDARQQQSDAKKPLRERVGQLRRKQEQVNAGAWDPKAPVDPNAGLQPYEVGSKVDVQQLRDQIQRAQPIDRSVTQSSPVTQPSAAPAATGPKTQGLLGTAPAPLKITPSEFAPAAQQDLALPEPTDNRPEHIKRLASVSGGIIPDSMVARVAAMKDEAKAKGVIEKLERIRQGYMNGTIKDSNETHNGDMFHFRQMLEDGNVDAAIAKLDSLYEKNAAPNTVAVRSATRLRNFLKAIKEKFNLPDTPVEFDIVLQREDIPAGKAKNGEPLAVALTKKSHWRREMASAVEAEIDQRLANGDESATTLLRQLAEARMRQLISEAKKTANSNLANSMVRHADAIFRNADLREISEGRAEPTGGAPFNYDKDLPSSTPGMFARPGGIDAQGAPEAEASMRQVDNRKVEFRQAFNDFWRNYYGVDVDDNGTHRTFNHLVNLLVKQYLRREPINSVSPDQHPDRLPQNIESLSGVTRELANQHIENARSPKSEVKLLNAMLQTLSQKQFDELVKATGQERSATKYEPPSPAEMRYRKFLADVRRAVTMFDRANVFNVDVSTVAGQAYIQKRGETYAKQLEQANAKLQALYSARSGFVPGTVTPTKREDKGGVASQMAFPSGRGERAGERAMADVLSAEERDQYAIGEEIREWQEIIRLLQQGKAQELAERFNRQLEDVKRSVTATASDAIAEGAPVDKVVAVRDEALLRIARYQKPPKRIEAASDNSIAATTVQRGVLRDMIADLKAGRISLSDAVKAGAAAINEGVFKFEDVVSLLGLKVPTTSKPTIENVSARLFAAMYAEQAGGILAQRLQANPRAKLEPSAIGKIDRQSMMKAISEHLRSGMYNLGELIDSLREYGIDVDPKVTAITSQLAVRKSLATHLVETGGGYIHQVEWLASLRRVIRQVNAIPSMVIGDVVTLSKAEKRLYDQWINKKMDMWTRRTPTKELEQDMARNAKEIEQAFPQLLFVNFHLDQMRDFSQIRNEADRLNVASLFGSSQDAYTAWMQDIDYALAVRPDIAASIRAYLPAEEVQAYRDWKKNQIASAQRDEAMIELSKYWAAANKLVPLPDSGFYEQNLPEDKRGAAIANARRWWSDFREAALDQKFRMLGVQAEMQERLLPDMKLAKKAFELDAERQRAELREEIDQLNVWEDQLAAIEQFQNEAMSDHAVDGATAGDAMDDTVRGYDIAAGRGKGKGVYLENIGDTSLDDAINEGAIEGTGDFESETDVETGEAKGPATLTFSGTEDGSEPAVMDEKDIDHETRGNTFKWRTGEIFTAPDSILLARGPRRSMLSQKMVQSWVETIAVKWRNAPEIVVVPDVGHLPEPIRSMVLEKLGDQSDGKGLFVADTGTVYLFSDHLESEADVQWTLFHETMGHYGLRAFLGAGFDQFLYNAYSTRPEIRKLADAKMKEDGVGLLEATEEVLSDMAGDNKHSGLFKQMIGRAIQWMRKHGFEQVADYLASKTDAEIAYVLKSAREAVTDGPGPYRGAPFALRLANMRMPYEMFSLKDKATHAYARFDPWRNTWYVFTAVQGNPNTYNLQTVDDVDDVRAVMRRFGKIESRLRSGFYIEDKLFTDLKRHIPDFNAEPKKWKRMWNSVRIAAQNQYLPVFGAVEWLEKNGVVTDQFDIRKDLSGLYERKAAARVDQFRRTYVEPMMDLIAEAKKLGATEELINDYAVARHAAERNRQVQKINPRMPHGSGMAPAEVTLDDGTVIKSYNDVIAEVDRLGLRAVLERVGAITDKLSRHKADWMVADGLMHPSEAVRWKSAYKHYVNLSGRKEDLDKYDDPITHTGRKFNAGRGKQQRALGRVDVMPDVLARTIAAAESSIIRGEKNQVAQRLLGLMEMNYDPNFVSINKLASKRQFNNEKFQEVLGLRREIQRIGSTDPDLADALQSQIDSLSADGFVQEVEDQHYRNAKNVMIARVGGIPVMMEFKHTGKGSFAEAIHGAVYPPEMNWFLSGISKYQQRLGQMITTWNPAWLMVNFVRDAQTLFFNAAVDKRIGVKQAIQMTRLIPKAGRAAMFVAMDDYHPTTPPGKAAKTLLKRLVGTPDPVMLATYREARDQGALTAFIDRKSLEEQVNQIATALNGETAWDKVKGMFSIMELMTIPMEIAPRLAAYHVTRQAGWTQRSAAELAGEITVNFNMRGANPLLRSLYLFFNPAVQGSAKIMQLAKDNPARFAAASMGFVALGAMASAMGRMFSDDDDDGINKLDKVPSFKRATSIVLKADTPMGAIPVPYGWNAFFSAGVFSMDTAFGVQPITTTAKRIAQATWEAFLPLGGSGLESNKGLGMIALKAVAPTFALPILEYAVNENRYGGPIYKEGFPGQAQSPDSFSAFRSVNPVSRIAMEGLNRLTGGHRNKEGAVDINPAVIDHAINAYLPGLAAETYKAVGTGVRAARGENLKEQALPLIGRFTANVNEEAWNASAYRRAKELVDTKWKEFNSAETSSEMDTIRKEFQGLGKAKAIVAAVDKEIRSAEATYNKGLLVMDRGQVPEEKVIAYRNKADDYKKQLYAKAIKAVLAVGEGENHPFRDALMAQ